MPIENAIEKDLIDIFQLLLSKGVDINMRLFYKIL